MLDLVGGVPGMPQANIGLLSPAALADSKSGGAMAALIERRLCCLAAVLLLAGLALGQVMRAADFFAALWRLADVASSPTGQQRQRLGRRAHACRGGARRRSIVVAHCRAAAAPGSGNGAARPSGALAAAAAAHGRPAAHGSDSGRSARA